jgi:hypothetical protein
MRNRKILFSALLLVLSRWAAYGQGSPITVEIKSAQPEVKEGEVYLVSTVLRNNADDVQVMRHEACGYGDLWTTDNKSIHVAPSACEKPGFMGVTIKPGEVFQRDVQVYAKLAPGVGESGWVTFRLGFKGEFKSEKDPAQPSPTPQILWSNAVTLRATRDPSPQRVMGVSKTNLPADGNGTGGITITELHGVMNGTPLKLPPAGRKTSYLQTLSSEKIVLSGIEVSIEISGLADSGAGYSSKATVAVTNMSARAIPGPIQMIFDTLTPGVTLANATGSAREGPYIAIPNVPALGAGKSFSIDVEFSNPRNRTIEFVPKIQCGSMF